MRLSSPAVAAGGSCVKPLARTLAHNSFSGKVRKLFLQPLLPASPAKDCYRAAEQVVGLLLRAGLLITKESNLPHISVLNCSHQANISLDELRQQFQLELVTGFIIFPVPVPRSNTSSVGRVG